MILALLPAAGKSTRMGRPKLVLPLGGRTVLEHAVAALRQAGVEHVLVVVGPHVPELIPLAKAAGAAVCPLAQETPDMRATIEHGLNWVEERFHPGPDDAWLLTPADHPTLDAAVVRQLGQARAAHPDRSIFIPVFAGRRGHPTLIGWKHVAGVRAHPAGQGLNAYLRLHGAETLEVPVTSADVLRDLDTPEDYERLLRTWRG
jgi:molybdenum cofactor cytidylyltransferase